MSDTGRQSPPMQGATDELLRVLADQDLHALFQPIIDLRNGSVIGYEGLTRGPSGSFLHSPVVLFDVADAAGLLAQTERMALARIVTRFAELQLPGLLFVNVTPATLSQELGFRYDVQTALAQRGVSPDRVVVELTETHAFADSDVMLAGIAELRSAGLRVALDDLGEGFAGLRRWTLMRPDFVKIDRHFMDGLARDPVRQQFVKSIVDMARSAHCTVIGEGVEAEGDLMLLRDLGVHLAQGYAIARPVPSPRHSTSPEIERLLKGSRYDMAGPVSRVTASTFVRPGRTVPTSMSCAEVVEILQGDTRPQGVAVLDEAGCPVGMLRMLSVLSRASGRFFMELFGKRPCTELMDRHPLIFDVGASVKEMSDAIALIDERHLVDGFIVTQGGRYEGVGRVGDLLRAAADLQLRHARYANPLTLLPGNVPIDEHIESLMGQQQPMVVVHWDISDFKPFNDVYGYRRGDDVILYCSDVLRRHLDPNLDFLGHVGGDDFVAVMTCPDWLARIEASLLAFSADFGRFLDDSHREAGGYVAPDRQGVSVWHAAPTLAAGAVVVEANSARSHRDIAQAAAEAKRLAKRASGPRLFIDRRRRHGPPGAPPPNGWQDSRFNGA